MLRFQSISAVQSDPQFTPISSLTQREGEIAELITEGLSNEQIAERLVLTPGTVANHVAHMLQKLGLQSRVQVAVDVAVRKTIRKSDRVFALLERLREVDAAGLNEALGHAADVLASTFAADKADAFIYDPTEARLVAIGRSGTPMGDHEHALGLDQLPIADGGRVVRIFRDSRPFINGRVEGDLDELLGVRCGLGVRSMIGVPLEVREGTLGVLVVSSAWVGLVAREHSPAQAG